MQLIGILVCMYVCTYGNGSIDMLLKTVNFRSTLYECFSVASGKCMMRNILTQQKTLVILRNAFINCNFYSYI